MPLNLPPPGGKLGVEVHGKRREQTVLISVWDQGTGINPDELDNLFEPFVQPDSGLSRQYPGTGLGPGLVQRIAALHGGGVRVESTPGLGSRFIVSLPWSGETTQIRS